MRHMLIALLLNQLIALDQPKNVIQLSNYTVAIESSWMIMSHEPRSDLIKYVSVAIIGSHIQPDWGATYMVIDTTKPAGEKAYKESIEWHGQASGKYEYPDFLGFGIVKTNAQKKVIAINFIKKSDDPKSVVLVTFFKPAPDGYSGDYKDMMNVCAQYADCIQLRR